MRKRIPLVISCLIIILAVCIGWFAMADRKGSFDTDSQLRLQAHDICPVPEKLEDGWEVAALKSAGLDSGKLCALISAIRNGTYVNIHSLLLVKKDRLVLEAYFHQFNADTFHPIRSATKSIGSLLTGIAIDKGFIAGVEEKIYPHFKSVLPEKDWDERAKSITLGHLLTMTSGYDCDDHQTGFSCEKNMYRADDQLEYALNLPMRYTPGEHWVYNSASLWLVGEMISRQARMPIPRFARKYLLDPLEIREIKWGFSPKGRAWIAGNAAMKPRDMAKIGCMVLNRGKWKGRQIVSERWLEESTAGHVPLKEMQIYDGEYGYGYLWWCVALPVRDRQVRIIAASGNGGQIIAIIPEYEMAAVFTGGNYNSDLSSQPVEMLIKYIIPSAM